MLDKDAQRANPQGSPPACADPSGFLQKFSGVQLLGAKTMVFSRTGQFRGFTGIPGGGGRKEQTDLDMSVSLWTLQDGGQDSELLP